MDLPARTLNDRSPNLDVLRTLAVSFVVVSHVLLDHSLDRIGHYHTQTLGTLGVMIFFVHTCLVLMRSLARHDGTGTRRAAALSFLASRIFRIYPLSVAVVLLLAALGWGPHLAPPALLSNVFLVQNLSGSPSITPVLWSLPFEVQMYLFLPALYWWTGAGAWRAWRRVLALWGMCVLLVGACRWYGAGADLVKFFPCFLPGVLAYCLRTAPLRWPAGVLFGGVGAAAIVYPLLVGLGASATVLAWGLCLGLGGLIPSCADVTWAWVKAGAAIVARYSYGVYLVHVTVLDIAFHRLKGMPPALDWLVFAGGVAALSYAAYHVIEKPGIGFGRRVVDRMAVLRRRSAQNI
jgi:peptidoglycan/LPS O-acetylase OafA/YrhL